MAISHVADLFYHLNTTTSAIFFQIEVIVIFNLFHGPLFHFPLTQNSRERQPFSSQFFETLIIIFQTGNTKTKIHLCLFSPSTLLWQFI